MVVEPFRVFGTIPQALDENRILHRINECPFYYQVDSASEEMAIWPCVIIIDHLAAIYAINLLSADVMGPKFQRDTQLSDKFINKMKYASQLTVKVIDPEWNLQVEGRFNYSSLEDEFKIMSDKCGN